MPIATMHPALRPFLPDIKELFKSKAAYTKSKLDVKEAANGGDRGLTLSYRSCNQANRVDEEMKRDALSKKIISLIKPPNFDYLRVYEDDSIGTITIRHSLGCHIVDGPIEPDRETLTIATRPSVHQVKLKEMFKAGIYKHDRMEITEKVKVTYRLKVKGKAKK
jgi:hypothetical protein